MTSSQLPSVKLSAKAAEFVPPSLAVDAGAIPVVCLRICEALNMLMSNPEDFDVVANYLSSQLTELIQNDDSLTLVVDEIVDQSLYIDNLQYLIARLCTFLFSHLPEEVAISFRSGLLTRCELEFDQKDEKIKTAEGCSALVKFSLFFGELMLQMTAETGDALEQFPGKVIDLVACMLLVICDETIKGVVQIVKLTGAFLQKYKPAQTDQLFKQLKQTIIDEKLTNSQRGMLFNLVELRASTDPEEDFDVGLATSQINSLSQYDPVPSVVDAHFSGRGDANAENATDYLSDSSDDELAMERIFERYGADDFEIINSGEDQFVVPRGIDTEMEDAFEAFIASHSNAR